VAIVSPASRRPPNEAVVRRACGVLADRGFTEVLTGALAPDERRGFLDAGFVLRDSLHLLAHDLRRIPEAPSTAIRRGRRLDRPRALAVDGRCFPAFWRLDRDGLREAMRATPVHRFRVAADRRRVVGYAVTGRAGSTGYLQRLAVDPDAAGRGLGRALVADALTWVRQHGGTWCVVNTQTTNERAIGLYVGMGFVVQPAGLEVLGRSLGGSPA
jgi:ribosomal protein S18 acetylase RimI-like enzyme